MLKYDFRPLKWPQNIIGIPAKLRELGSGQRFHKFWILLQRRQRLQTHQTHKGPTLHVGPKNSHPRWQKPSATERQTPTHISSSSSSSYYIKILKNEATSDLSLTFTGLVPHLIIAYEEGKVDMTATVER